MLGKGVFASKIISPQRYSLGIGIVNFNVKSADGEIFFSKKVNFCSLFRIMILFFMKIGACFKFAFTYMQNKDSSFLPFCITSKIMAQKKPFD